MAGRQSSRFEMLINITSKGGPELNKLGSAAKKLQAIFDHLDKAIDKTQMTTGEGQDAFRKFAAALGGLIKQTNDYYQAKRKLNNELRKDPSKQNAANITKFKGDMAKAKAAAEGYRDTINGLVPGLVKLDFRTKNAGLNTEFLSKAQGEATAKAKLFTSAVTKKSRAEEKSTRSTKKNTIEVEKNTAATKKNEFATNALRQRLDTTGSSTFAKLRRQVGAFRNQILLLTFATVGLRSAFNSAFLAANELEASLKGLGAVAANTGNNMQGARQAAIDLSQKGLLTIQDAAAGLKNLLSAGFGLPEAIKLMDTLTNSASFNRQGTLALGQAVVGATQGIKNQNSIMVDNAGITKNLSIMYKEFAATIGTSAGTLDEAQKRQAIFNGILKEGAIFAGDAEKVVLTMAGAITKLGVTSTQASAEVGKLTQPLAKGFVMAVAEASSALEKMAVELNKNPEFMTRMIEAGYKLEEVLRLGLSAIGAFAQGLGKVLGIFSRYTISLMGAGLLLAVYNKRTRAVSKSINTLTADHLEATTVQELNNKGIQKQVTLYGIADRATYKTLSLKQRYRIELQRLTLNEEALTGATVKTARAMQLKASALRTVTGASTTAAAGVKLLGISIKGLIATVKPFLVAFIVFEGLAFVITRLIQAFKGVEKQSEVNKRRNDELTKTFEHQFKVIQNGNEAVVETSRRFLDTQYKTYALQQQMLKVYIKGNEILGLREKFAKAETAAEQAEIQTQINLKQEQYDVELGMLKQHQLEIQRMTEGHLANLAAARTAYDEELEAAQKRRGNTEVIEARQNYLKRLKQQETFNLSFQKLTEQERMSPQMVAKQTEMDNAVEMSKQNLQFVRETSLASHYARLEAQTENHQKRMFELNSDDIKRIQGQFASKLEKELKDAKETYDLIIQNASSAYTAAQEDYLKGVSQSFIQSDAIGARTSSGKNYATNPAAIADDIRMGAGKGPVAPQGAFKMAEDIQKVYAGLSDSQKTFKQGLLDSNLSVEETNKLLGEYKTNLLGSKAALEEELDVLKGKIGTDNAVYQNVKANVEGLDALIASIDTASKEYKILTGEKKLFDDESKQATEAYRKTVDAIKETLSVEEKRALGAAFYREDLKKLSVTYKELELQIQGILTAEGQLTGALGRSVLEAQRAADTTNKYRNSTQSLKGAFLEFINPLQNSDALLRKQSQATEELENKQKAQAAALNDKLMLAGFELQAEKDILAQGIATGKYTDQQVIDQEKRIAVSQAKVDAILAETAATEKLSEIERKVLEDNQAAARMQEQIANMTAYANFFGGFIEKMQNLEHNRLMANMKYQKKLKKEVMDGVLNQKQADQLAIENQKLTAAEKAKNEKLALAGLIRDVGRQIMVYAAKKAAESGNIAAALGMLAAGVAANAMINSYANKVTREAERDYMDAQAQFERREAEIRGEGDNQPGSANQQRFGGSIKAENLSVEINPTVVIQGEQVFIGQGSVNEFGAELQALLLTSVNDAIENREIDLSNVQG